MEFLEGNSYRSELMSFLPRGETSFNLSDRQLLVIIGAIDKEVDVLAQMQDAYKNFIDSGQVWALLIGLILGYIFRSFTAY
jgi:hypothetical protein